MTDDGKRAARKAWPAAASPVPAPPRRVRVERGIYRSPRTGNLEIQYTDSEGRVRWKRVSGGLREARYARAEVQARLGRGERVAPSNRAFAEVAQDWLAEQRHLRPGTRQLYESALRLYLLPHLGSWRISAIDTDAVAALIVDLDGRGLAGSTIRGILTPLGRILAHAARRGLIPDNPALRLERGERPTVSRREMRVLRSQEIDELLRAATPSYRPILATAVFTGLRQGELLGLDWSDIDFAAGVIKVRRQLDRTGARTAPKTRQALREVILMPSLARLLIAHRLASAHSGPRDVVFATQTGAAMNYRNVTRRGLAAAVSRTAIDQVGEPRLRFHDLRHTFASLLIAQGLNVVFVSRQLGHASPSFTLNVYGGLFDRAEHGRRATEALEGEFGHYLSASTALD